MSLFCTMPVERDTAKNQSSQHEHDDNEPILHTPQIYRRRCPRSSLRFYIMADAPDFDQLSCPVPMMSYENVLLGHGSGGKLSAELIQGLFLSEFRDETLARLEDQATLQLDGARLAFTTDSYVVRPLFFPGGDIGRLAVHGTINDLAVGGAKPVCLSAAFILE